jgi:hypothetical protein
MFPMNILWTKEWTQNTRLGLGTHACNGKINNFLGGISLRKPLIFSILFYNTPFGKRGWDGQTDGHLAVVCMDTRISISSSLNEELCKIVALLMDSSFPILWRT